MMTLRANTRVVQQEADNSTFRMNAEKFRYGASGEGFMPYFKGTQYDSSLMAYVDGYTAVECFKNTGYTASEWIENIYVAE